MPIILLWNETVEGSLAQFQRWLDSFERSNFLLERWLEKRVREAEDLERLTNRFPVFRFYNEAVTARLGSFQFGALLTAPVAGVGDHMERALGQWNVARRLSGAVRENRLLPELFGVLEEITSGILASIDRFRRPTAAMFDPTQRRLSDLPGLAVMAYRALATSRDQILRAATNVRDAFVPTTEGGPSERSEGAGPGEPRAAASALPLSFQLDELTRYLVAGLLVIPALGRLIGVIGSDLLLHLRYVLLDVLQGIEARAFGFRRRILEVFVYDLDVYARQGVQFVLAAKEVAVSYLQFYAQVGIEYLRGVIGGVGTFASQLQTFWSGQVDVIHQVLRYGNAVIGINIGPVIHRALEAAEDGIETIDTHAYSFWWWDHPEWYKAPKEFPVTVEELVMNQGAGVRANRELSRAIRLVGEAWRGADPFAAASVRGATHWLTGMDILRYIVALHGVRYALSLPRAGAPVQPTLTLDLSAVPDLTAEVIRPLRDGLNHAVNHAVTGVAVGIEGVVVAAVDTLDSTAVAFDNAAANAARMGSLRLLGLLTSNTDALMESLFGDQEIRRSETGFEPVAGAYAQWLIQGGFDMIGAAMAGFIGMVLEEWVVHLEENADTPVEVTATSPRRLLERARLGRVHTPEVRIVARGQDLGRSLAARIADGFQELVQRAYATGQANLDRALATAPEATTP